MIFRYVVVIAIIFLLAGVGTVLWAARRRRDLESAASPPQWPRDEVIEELLREGRKSEAIKRHRVLFGSDLIEAKTAIDALLARLPRRV